MVELIAATVAHEAAGEGHAEATALGFGPGGWVAIAMLLVLGIMIWKKVPGAIAKALDAKIDAIREQLAEAESLRMEALALKEEYEAKAAAAGEEAAAMIERAKAEAKNLVAKAKADSKEMIARRGKLAEERIAAEERAAVGEIRAMTAQAAAAAAAKLVADGLDPKADDKLIDEAIAKLG